MAERQPSSEQALSTLNRQWMHAYTQRDLEFLETHMSEDYVGTFPDGSVHDKKSEIEAVKSGAVKINQMTPKEMKVRIYDNAGVITGRSHIEAEVGGQVVKSDFRFTDVWVRQEGEWQAVASQVTRVEGEATLQGA